MSNKVPSSEVTKWILRSSHDSFVHFCDDSAGKTKAKHMENGLIFHVTIQIQILTMFSVQSKYSKKTKSISLLGFVISNKTCKIWNVQIQCQPSRLSSPYGWKPNSFLPMHKRPMDSSHHTCQIFTLWLWATWGRRDPRSMCLSLLDLQLDVPDHLLVLELGTFLIVHQEPLHPVLGCFQTSRTVCPYGFAERHLLVLEILLAHVIDRFGLGRGISDCKRWSLLVQSPMTLRYSFRRILGMLAWTGEFSAISTSFGHGKTDCGSCVKFTEIFFVKLQVVLLGFHSRRGFGDLFWEFVHAVNRDASVYRQPMPGSVSQWQGIHFGFQACAQDRGAEEPNVQIPDAAAKVLFCYPWHMGILDTGATKTVMGSDFVPGFYKMFMSVSEARFAGAPVMWRFVLETKELSNQLMQWLYPLGFELKIAVVPGATPFLVSNAFWEP